MGRLPVFDFLQRRQPLREHLQLADRRVGFLLVKCSRSHSLMCRPQCLHKQLHLLSECHQSLFSRLQNVRFVHLYVHNDSWCRHNCQPDQSANEQHALTLLLRPIGHLADGNRHHLKDTDLCQQRLYNGLERLCFRQT